MQIEKQQDLMYVATDSDYDLNYMGVVDSKGNELPLTSEMIDQAYQALLAQAAIKHTLTSV